MPAAPDDWRRRGQEHYARGVRLTWKRYQAFSARWEHEHCEFCWQKFLDAESSAARRRASAEPADKTASAGYTNLADGDVVAGKWWVCQRCFADFADELEWVVVDSDPDEWPYTGPGLDAPPVVADDMSFDGQRPPQPE